MVGWIFSWALIFKRGQVGPNRFGEDPLKLEAPRASRPVQEWAFAAMVALVVMGAVVGLRTFVFQPYTIPSGSMGPTLKEGDYVIVSKSAYGFSKHSIPFSPPLFQGRIFNKIPQRGDIVVFKSPRDPKVDYIKRLIGLPGDRVQIRGGVVFVNDKPIERTLVSSFMDDLDGTPIPAQLYRETPSGGGRYLIKSYITDQAAENTGVYVTPPHCYFLLGDNRDNSLDSRFDPNMSAQPIGPSNCGWDASVDAYIPGEAGTGFVPEENLVGRAVLVVAPTGKPRFRWLMDR
jgi:signal peptidase I